MQYREISWQFSARYHHLRVKKWSISANFVFFYTHHCGVCHTAATVSFLVPMVSHIRHTEGPTSRKRLQNRFLLFLEPPESGRDGREVPYFGVFTILPVRRWSMYRCKQGGRELDYVSRTAAATVGSIF